MATTRRTHGFPIFSEMLDDIFGFDDKTLQASFKRFPAANISETDDLFVIEMTLPGRTKKDIQINLEKNILTVSSEKADGNTENKESYHRREFHLSAFSRAFRLPENVDDEKIDAVFKSGILNLSISKKENTKIQREIKIS